MAGQLLNKLRADAVSLVEHDLPTVAEVRPVLAALLNRFEQLVDRLAAEAGEDVLDKIFTTDSDGVTAGSAAPAGESASALTQPALVAQGPSTGELQAVLVAERERSAELEAALARANASTPPLTPEPAAGEPSGDPSGASA